MLLTKVCLQTENMPINRTPRLIWPPLLVQGDNNLSDDTELYAEGDDFLNRKEDIVGSVRGYIPMVYVTASSTLPMPLSHFIFLSLSNIYQRGYVTIMLSEHPWLKTVLLGLMGLMVMLQRE